MKITLEIPDDQIKEVLETPKKAVWKDGKVIFEDIKSQLPETWEEFCDNYKIQKEECYINTDAEIKTAVPSRNRLIYGDSNVLPNKQAAEAHLALMQLHQLRDCYRQGWVPELTTDETKYCIYKVGNEFWITTVFCTSHFLLFQSRELAKKFLDNFKDLINKAGDLI